MYSHSYEFELKKRCFSTELYTSFWWKHNFNSIRTLIIQTYLLSSVSSYSKGAVKHLENDSGLQSCVVGCQWWVLPFCLHLIKYLHFSISLINITLHFSWHWHFCYCDFFHDKKCMSEVMLVVWRNLQTFPDGLYSSWVNRFGSM